MTVLRYTIEFSSTDRINVLMAAIPERAEIIFLAG